MLTNYEPLKIASGVLANTTIDSVLRSASYHARGWQILDRWALNFAKRLRELEAAGELVLLGRLLEQQRLEQEALISPLGLAQRSQGLAEHEILALCGISDDLYVSAVRGVDENHEDCLLNGSRGLP